MAVANIVGVDPHRRTFTACVLDERGGLLRHEHFPNTVDGYRAAVSWATELGLIERWGVKNASNVGRHFAEFIVEEGFDVMFRHIEAPTGGGAAIKGRPIVSTLIASPKRPRATRASPALSSTISQRALIRSVSKSPCGTMLGSLTRVRVQLLGEIDAMIRDLPEELRTQTSRSQTVRARIYALDRVAAESSAAKDPVVRLRLELIEQRVAMLREVLEQDRIAGAELVGS